MSAICVLTIAMPAAAVGWPLVAAAAVAAASSLGYAAVRTGESHKTQAPKVKQTSVELTAEGGADSVAAGMALGEEMVFTRDGVQVRVLRDTRGRVSVRVEGCGRSDAELRSMGQELLSRIAQQYAYHRIVTELKERDFHLAGEEREADGTVRLRVRIYQGE